jgi:hypothetical protein
MSQQNLELHSRLGKQGTDERLKLWMEFLRISPSYAVAHQMEQGLLSEKEARLRVEDFATVRRVFDDFGNVWETSPDVMWDTQAFDLFGVMLAEPDLKVVHTMQAGMPTDEFELQQVIRDYANITRKQMGDPLTVLVSVPIDMERTKLLSLFRGMVSYFKENRQDYENPAIPTPRYEFASSRKPIRTLRQLLALINYISKDPNKPQWQIGTELNINRAKADVLRKRRPVALDKINARNVMNATVSRLIKQALAIAENAARGIYISQNSKPEHMYRFDWQYISQNLSLAAQFADEWQFE